MDEGLQGVVNNLIAQQNAQTVWGISIAFTLLAGVTLSAWLWRTQARLQALEETMSVLQQHNSSQTLSGKIHSFRRNITIQAAAVGPIARTRSAQSTTRPRQTGIAPFRTRAEDVLSNDEGASHSSNDAAFEQNQDFHRLKPSGIGPLLLQESFSRSFSGVESALMNSLPAEAQRKSLNMRRQSNLNEARPSTLRSRSEDVLAKVASTLPRSRSDLDLFPNVALPPRSPPRSLVRSPHSRSDSSAGGKSTVMKQSSGKKSSTHPHSHLAHTHKYTYTCRYTGAHSLFFSHSLDGRDFCTHTAPLTFTAVCLCVRACRHACACAADDDLGDSMSDTPFLSKGFFSH